MKRWKLSLFLLPLLFVGLIFGIAKLFQLRFDQGDIYPPGSSLRSDPLGGKVFFESLRDLESLEVTRLYEPLNKVGSGKGKSLFVIAAGAWDLNWVPREEMKQIEDFVFQGGRLVITFQPLNSKNWKSRREEKRAQVEEKEKEAKDQKDKKKTRRKMSPEEEEFPMLSLLDKWQLDFAYHDLETDEDGTSLPETVVLNPDYGSLPETLAWHTALYFKNTPASWQKIYSLGGTNAAVIERQFGQGTVVLSSDSYSFSNEAMRREREAALLAWFIGPNREVLFDETHFGLQADPGIAALARKYRLHGLIAGLLLLAGLFVWKNAISFVPPIDDDIFEGRNAIVTGKESAAGFVNLLRRSISPAEIVSTCLAEWKKSGAHPRQKASSTIERLDALAREEASRSKRERNPVQSYRNISAVLTERK